MNRSLLHACSLAIALSVPLVAQHTIEIKTHPMGESNPTDITPFLDKVLFFNSSDHTLWISDGRSGTTQPPVGTRQIPGPTQTFGWFTVLGGRAFFSASDSGSPNPTLWVTDGLTAWKAPVQFPAGSTTTELRDPEWLTRIGDVIYMSADGGNGKEPWMFDGTTATPLPEINPTGSSNPMWFAGFGDRVVFQADNGVHGRELWHYDGQNMRMLPWGGLNPEPLGSPPGTVNHSNPRFMTPLRWVSVGRPYSESVVFIARAPLPGQSVAVTRPWVTDFTEGGTLPLELSASGIGSTEIVSAPFSNGDTVCFPGVSFAGWDIWTTDGTEVGTRPMGLPPSGSQPESMTLVGSRHLYMTRFVSGAGTHPTVIDLQSGWVTPIPLDPLSGASLAFNQNPALIKKPFAVVDGKVFMSAKVGWPNAKRHLWVIDNGATAQASAYGCSNRTWLAADDPLQTPSATIGIRGGTSVANAATAVLIGIPRYWLSGMPAPLITRLPDDPGWTSGGCEFHLNGTPIFHVPPRSGVLFNMGLPVPANPSLLAQTFMIQAISVGQEGPRGIHVETTNPVRMTINSY